MDCNEAYFSMQMKGRGNVEAAPGEFAELDRHLAACPHCSRVARSLAAEDAALSRAMAAVPVPQGLRLELHRQLRDHTHARRRMRSYRLVATAAAVLIAVGIGLGVTSAARPPLDLVQFTLDQDARFENPDEPVRLWLAANHLPERPLPFNMALLVAQGTEKIQGREVPYLVFSRPGEGREPRIAKLFFLKDQQFVGLKDLREAQSSRFQTRILRDERQFPGVTMLVLFTGQTDDDLKPFLLTHNQT